MRLPVSLVAARDLHQSDCILVMDADSFAAEPAHAGLFVSVIAPPVEMADGKVGIELATGEKWVVRGDAPMVTACIFANTQPAGTQT